MLKIVSFLPKDQKGALLFFIIICLFQSNFTLSQMPKPDHVVILMFQNKSYTQIVGSSNAPYINSLLADTNTAQFTQSFALTHPSQPNYLMLFSGNNQGVTNDNIPTNTPFTTCNLGASLIDRGHTFIGYSESMPSAGYLGDQTSLYFRKHNPWSDWQGTLNNNITSTANQPFSAFPSNYDNLPDVCFVVPNINNCMHNGTINQGDSWFQANLDAYLKWTLHHNSLLIVTFDEDDGNSGNRILTFFYGPMVKGGSYKNSINHYDVLKTLEDIYSAPYCGNSSTATGINYIWKSSFAGVEQLNEKDLSFKLFPNPAKDNISLAITAQEQIDNCSVAIKDIYGNTCMKKTIALNSGDNRINMNCPFSSGLYFLELSTAKSTSNHKFVIE